MKYEVLVVDDEAAVLRAILRGLGSESDLRPRGVTNLADAVEVLDNDPPDLLLTDIRLSGESGLDLIHELRNRGLRIPVIILTAYRAAHADEIALHPSLTVLEKPVPIAELRSLIRERLRNHSEQPSDDPFQLVDYLQLAGLAGRSLDFELELASGERGRLEVVHGALWNARAGESTGREALRRLLAERVTKLQYSRLEDLPRERQLTGSVQALLLEMAKERDEHVSTVEIASEMLDEVARRTASSALRPTPAGESHSPQDFDADCGRILEATGGSSCVVFDAGSGTALGCVNPDAGDLLGEITANALALFRPALPGTGAAAGQVEEVFILSRSLERFLKRVGGGSLVAAVATDGSVKKGLVWVAFRRILRGFGRPGRRPEAAADAQRNPLLGRELEPALSLVCRKVAAGITGARCCGLVDPQAGTLVGLSHPASDELLDAVTGWAVAAFRAAASSPGDGGPDAGTGAVEEILVSSAARYRFFLRLPEQDRLALLTTDRTELPAATWIALRDSLPHLVEALRAEVTTG